MAIFVIDKKDHVQRFKGNPIISTRDVKSSRAGLEVIGAFNAAAFEYKGRIGLLLSPPSTIVGTQVFGQQLPRTYIGRAAPARQGKKVLEPGAGSSLSSPRPRFI